MDERVIIWREYGVTEIHPAALLFTLLLSIVVIFVPRRQVAWPLLLVACLLPIAQRIVIGTIDFSMIRIFLLFAWGRIVLRGELRPLQLNAVDVCFCTWLFFGTLIPTLREASVSALVYRLGFDFDAIGTYFLFRLVLRNADDVVSLLRQLAWISIPISGFMVIEWLTGRNWFSIFGGVLEETLVRGGRLRCQGAFSHPIMAGTFGAMLAPLFLGSLLYNPARGLLFGAGLLASTLITMLSASSGPLLSYLVAILAWGLWPLRRNMREFRWALLAVTVVVHFIRERPVWHLIGRAGEIIGSGTGYHRYQLIDAFVNRFGEWWLLGTASTAHWGWGLQDLTNQFVNEGVRGGLWTLLAFTAIPVAGYAMTGSSMRRIHRASVLSQRSRRRLKLLCWGVGASLTVHLVSFLSVAYFGQMQVLFYMMLAVVATSMLALAPTRRTAAVAEPPPPERGSAEASVTPRG